MSESRPPPHPAISIPTFHPLPEDTIIHRLINRLLAPIFYLLFTILTTIIVVPIYTIVENFKHGASSAPRTSHSHPSGDTNNNDNHSTSAGLGSDASYEVTPLAGGRDKGKGGGTLGQYLREWGGSYRGKEQ